MTETAPKFYESGNGKVNWQLLPASNEILWFSERDNWGQLYLYDLTTGKLKNQITHGDGNVTQVLHIDEKNRVIYFLAVGKEAGRDPYYQALYSIHFDGTGQRLLTPEDADHVVTFSPDGRSVHRRVLHAHDAADHRRPQPRRQGRHGRRPSGHHPPRRRRLGSAHADQGEGARRPDRALRLHVQADEPRSDA